MEVNHTRVNAEVQIFAVDLLNVLSDHSLQQGFK
jgi:hypothetical protein